MFIRTEKLTHTYMPGTPFAAKALEDISFSIEKGQVALLIGQSGSGKTTLVQHLNGLLKPTGGMVYFDSQPLGLDKTALPALRRRIGLVFQLPEEQFFSETVFDEVAFAPKNLGVPGEEIARQVTEALERVGLDPELYQDRHPFHLSSGQKRLVAIAAVLSLKPDLLILDEPTAGLDPEGRARLFNLLADLNQNDHITLIISTHHYNEAAALADQVLVLKSGRLVMDGSRDEIFSRRDELEELGLSLPPVTELMHDLFTAGLEVKRTLYCVDDARKEIIRIIRGGCS